MMALRVLIIALLGLSTAAHAARGPRRTPPPKPCERILVNDDIIEAVNETGREIAELQGKFTLITNLRSAPESKINVVASEERLQEIAGELLELSIGLSQLRSNYTVSVDLVTRDHAHLKNLLAELKPRILRDLELQGEKPNSAVKERRRFMKREALRGLPDDLGDGDAEAIEDYLRKSEQPLATPPGFNPRQWPPREKP